MSQTAGAIACCLCGRTTAANEAVEGRCLACLASEVDLSADISKENEVELCKTCAANDTYRWFRNPQWVIAEPESAELLTLCVRKLRGMKAVTLVDARWLWTEPHSRRLKIKLTVAQDVLSGRTVQQSFVAEFMVKTRNCDRCNKLAAKDTWQAKVQVRQRADHPRTLLAMEQQMIKRQAELGRAPPVEVRRTKEGLDFLFLRRQHAQRFVTLLHSLAPCKSKASASVVAANAKTGTSNVKHTWSVEVAPICRGDLYEVTSDAYWRQPFTPLMSRGQLSTFVVLDVEADECGGRDGEGAAAHATDPSSSSKQAATFVQADATVARERDFGANDLTHYLRTHLGGKLAAGDEAVGYDLESMTSIDEAEEASLPQTVLLVDKKKPRDGRGGGSGGSGGSGGGSRGGAAGGGHGKRATGAARRRKKREASKAARGADGDGDGDGGSVCSGTSYQTEYSDLDGLDALAVALHEEDEELERGMARGEHDGEHDGDFAPALTDFFGTLDMGDAAADGDAEPEGQRDDEGPHHEDEGGAGGGADGASSPRVA